MRRSTLSGVFLLTGLLVSTSASATPIPIGTTTAQDLIVNFDFSSIPAPNAPPYNLVEVDVNLSGVDSGEQVTVDFFTGLGGTTFLSNTVAVSNGIHTINLMDPGIQDGQFSFGFRINTGAVELVTPVTSHAFRNGGSGDPVASVEGTVSAVPEPTSLLLLSTGLLGVGVRRHHRSRA